MTTDGNGNASLTFKLEKKVGKVLDANSNAAQGGTSKTREVQGGGPGQGRESPEGSGKNKDGGDKDGVDDVQFDPDALGGDEGQAPPLNAAQAARLRAGAQLIDPQNVDALFE